MGVGAAFRFFPTPNPSPRELTFRLVRSPTRFLLFLLSRQYKKQCERVEKREKQSI